MDETQVIEIWSQFLASKVSSPLGEFLQGSRCVSYQNNILVIQIDESQRENAQNKQQKIRNDLAKKHRFTGFEIQFISDAVSLADLNAPPPLENPPVGDRRNNPLQTLYWVEPNLPAQKDESPRMDILQASIEAEKACTPICDRLNDRTKRLAENGGMTFRAQFPWRLRVGGTRGFRELLLPVLHPVFGIPYLPASSLKGAARAWARDNQQANVSDLLGFLDGKIARSAKVEFLDAFPTKPCLSVDMANNLWRWEGDRVRYNSDPHPLLSLEKPEFLIGIVATNRCQNIEELETVKSWLENALTVGIGSRVSAGYGRSSIISTSNISRHPFSLFTQGMHGAFRDVVEFRPTAVRGMLRYWFRAVALGLYSLQECKKLEKRLFGGIEPPAKKGSIRIAVELNDPQQGNGNFPWIYEGAIVLEAKSTDDLNLAQYLLRLASHLGGIGQGARRPLHWNNDRLRGCHWELTENILPAQQQDWRNFLDGVIDAFVRVNGNSTGVGAGEPGTPSDRNQDVLNQNTRIYLVPCPNLTYPERVQNWSAEGITSSVRGLALEKLYGDNRFKGQTKDKKSQKVTGGNPNVGGAMGTPSYVVIQSNFPIGMMAYQTVTIFGANQIDRVTFANVLPSNSIQVWPLPQNQSVKSH